ncbi:hypothetical protein IKE67_02205 [bacterium]|nr:hypothetical protein [bacterium]
MNSNVAYSDNELKFGVKKVLFKLKIRTVEVLLNSVIVLLEVPYDDNVTLNNIHAFNLFGDKLWTVQPVSEKYPNLKNYLPFENLMYVGDKLSASDFMGRKFFINIKDGTIIGMDTFK